ncbi:MAG: oligosaccharide flippase family protein, partial [Candidatus Marinimicrobia bacterium]|nr:oligosaccharide flippase family protein [Candidatus Neomarinimicrobiota bacterium]
MTVSDNLSSSSLKSNVLELSKHSFIYGVGVLSRLSSFILLPIHTAYLSQHDYGILILLLSFIGIATVFTTYGLNVSFLRWYVPETDEEERKRIFSICYYGIAGMTLLLTVIILTSSTSLASTLLRDTDYKPMFMMAGLILLMDSLFHFPQMLLQARKNSFGYIGVVFLNVTLNLGLSWYFIVKLGFGINGVLYSALIAGFAA